MLISAANRKSDPGRMCRLIVKSAPAVLDSTTATDAARAVYVATILQFLEMFRYSTLKPRMHPGGVLVYTPIYRPALQQGKGSADNDLEPAFNTALQETFGEDVPRETGIAKLVACFQTYLPDDKIENAGPTATREEAQRFLLRLAQAIPA